jgi:hypothetical protein
MRLVPRHQPPGSGTLVVGGSPLVPHLHHLSSALHQTTPRFLLPTHPHLARFLILPLAACDGSGGFSHHPTRWPSRPSPVCRLWPPPWEIGRTHSPSPLQSSTTGAFRSPYRHLLQGHTPPHDGVATPAEQQHFFLPFESPLICGISCCDEPGFIASRRFCQKLGQNRRDLHPSSLLGSKARSVKPAPSEL